MPDTYEATDPKTGKKWTWDGQKWNEAGPSTYQKITASDNPLDPVTGQPSANWLSRTLQSTGAAFAGLPGAIYHGATDPATPEEKERFKREGHRIIPGELALERLTGAESIVDAGKAYADPKTRPSFKQAMSVFPEALGGGIGTVAGGEAAGAVVPPALKAVGKAVETPAKSTLRTIFGAGKRATERIKAEETAKQTGVVEKATAKRETAKGKYGEAVGEQLESAKESSAKESAAKTKQQALATKQGPVYQRMNEMTEDAATHIKEVEQKVNQQETAKWETFKDKMEDAPVSTKNVVSAIENAQSNILTGDSVPVFKQILSEIAEDDPLAQASVFRGKGAVDIKEVLQKAAPAVRERLLRDLEAQGFDESSGGFRAIDVPLDLARRLYTKISRKLNGSELPRDVARALGTVQDSLDSSIAEGVVNKGGPEALREYRKLQSDWKQYRQTFSDKDSPLRKIVEAKDPNTRRAPITSEMGERATQYLGRYRDLGAAPEKLGRIRALDKALKELPTSGGKAPGAPERPSLPKVPEMKIPSPEEIRRGLLQKAGQGGTGVPSTWEIIFPRALIKRYLIKNMLLQNPKFIDWLAKDKTSGTPVP